MPMYDIKNNYSGIYVGDTKVKYLVQPHDIWNDGTTLYKNNGRDLYEFYLNSGISYTEGKTSHPRYWMSAASDGSVTVTGGAGTNRWKFGIKAFDSKLKYRDTMAVGARVNIKPDDIYWYLTAYDERRSSIVVGNNIKSLATYVGIIENGKIAIYHPDGYAMGWLLESDVTIISGGNQVSYRTLWNIPEYDNWLVYQIDAKMNYGPDFLIGDNYSTSRPVSGNYWQTLSFAGGRRDKEFMFQFMTRYAEDKDKPFSISVRNMKVYRLWSKDIIKRY